MRRLIGAALAATLSTAAVAQTTGPDIVVQANERKAIDTFVRTLIDPGPEDQLPRWDRSICSGIIGLSVAQAELINGRIAAAAKLAGLTMGDAGCRPTVLTIVTDQAPAVAGAIARRFPVTLGRDGRWRVSQFAQINAPVRWISRTGTGAADGGPAIGTSGIDVPEYRSLTGSRLAKRTRTTLAFVLIVVDAAQLKGMSLGTLGDYLAMVALTRPQFGKPPPGQSILSYFDHRDIDSLSEYDRRYIVSLYRAPASGSTQSQASSIRTGMREGDR